MKLPDEDAPVEGERQKWEVNVICTGATERFICATLNCVTCISSKRNKILRVHIDRFHSIKLLFPLTTSMKTQGTCLLPVAACADKSLAVGSEAKSGDQLSMARDGCHTPSAVEK